MSIIDIIGSCAGLLTTMALLPQVVKAHMSRHTKDLSLAMFVLFSCGLCLWILYGVALHSIPVIVTNSITLLLELYLIYLKVKYG